MLIASLLSGRDGQQVNGVGINGYFRLYFGLTGA
jgi:hypothetical protein